MPSRALVIAIENYPTNPDLAGTLPGTHEHAIRFRSWLKGSAGFAGMAQADEPSRVLICTDDRGFPGRTHDATGRGIRQAVYALWEAGRDNTGELFVYYSGHGFFFAEVNESAGERACDVIVPADFSDMMVDGGLCFRLEALQNELVSSMGPGNHYYFVDACRNQVRDDDIAVGSPVRLRRSTRRDSHAFTLFSRSRRPTAPAARPFTDLLVAGLRSEEKPSGGPMAGGR